MTSPRRLDRSYQTGLVWFRRDLRDTDNAALYYALKHCERVWCAFVFDTTILQPLIEIRRGEDGEARDRRIEFLHDTIGELDHALHEAGGGLIVLHGDPCDEIPALAKRLDVEAVFTNHDYEPQAIERDNEVRDRLREQKRDFLTFKDQTIFERDEILTGQNKPYTVFTPYKNAWLKTVRAFDLKPYPVEKYHAQLARPPKGLHPASPTLEQLGFARSDLKELGMKTGMSGARHLLDTFETRIDSYAEQRDFPAMKATSHLSMHLRFGTISIRTLARMAHEMSLQPHGEGAATWLSELIWRDFYFMVLHYNPRLGEGASFKPEYDGIRWETGAKADAAFTAWCEGRTGYPLVDAAMLQLNRTGFMHNRLRMVTASFLTKDLGIDWHLGERYFALQLNDFDFSANNGGWQWAASTGCDAQPYFRIFNPVTQSEKFDAQGRFIKQFLPQLADVPPKYIHAPWQASADQLAQWGVRLGDNYPEPMVDHAAAREKTLARYGQ